MVAGFHYFAAYLIVDLLSIALIFIIAGNMKRDSGSETQVRFFFLSLTAFLVFTVLDGVWAFFAYSGFVEHNYLALGIINGINMTAIAFAAYFWVWFTLARFECRVTNDNTIRALLAVPAALVPVIHTVGYFMGENVTSLPDGGIMYGVCHITINCIQWFYVSVATIYAIYKLRQATTRADRQMCMAFVAFMIPFIIAATVDTLIPGTPIAAASIVVSFVFIMTWMQESRISNDALTGLNNRRRADAFLDEIMPRVSPQQPLYLFIIDLDKFKEVNDTYGHLEGDHALQLMANALRRTCAQVNAFAARWAGDEFIIICPKSSKENPDDIVRLIKTSLADVAHEANLDYELSCSVGYALCETPNESYADILSRADVMLYEDKIVSHSRLARRVSAA